MVSIEKQGRVRGQGRRICDRIYVSDKNTIFHQVPHVINFNAAPDPQGRLSGLSKVFPNKMSFAEYGFKNLPGYHESQYRREVVKHSLP